MERTCDQDAGQRSAHSSAHGPQSRAAPHTCLPTHLMVLQIEAMFLKSPEQAAKEKEKKEKAWM